jgi:type I restriction enzyme S subunit
MEKLLPQLRFPEFESSLTALKLDDVVTFKSGGTPPKENESYWNGDIPWISAASMQGKYYSKSDRTITEEGLKKGSKLAIKGSLLILVRGSMLFNKIPLGITERDVAFNQDLKSLLVNNRSNTEYLYQWFSSKENLILDKVGGTGIGAGKLDTDDLKNLKLYLPSLPEQTKIATFLTAVDEKLTALKQKKSLLEQYKKGVMQQIFSQELRFKDDNGNDFADWEEKKLGEVCEYKNGGSFESFVCPEGEYNLISLNSLDINGKLKAQHKKVSTNDNSLKKGDLVMVLSDVAHGYFLGMTDIIPDNSFVLNQRMGALKPKVEINRFFLKTFINFNQNYFRLMGQGSSQQNLSKDDVLSFILILPIIQEQTKIANFLSAIDEKINHCQGQIDQTTIWKKGLLQQLFV